MLNVKSVLETLEISLPFCL